MRSVGVRISLKQETKLIRVNEKTHKLLIQKGKYCDSMDSIILGMMEKTYGVT